MGRAMGYSLCCFWHGRVEERHAPGQCHVRPVVGHVEAARNARSGIDDLALALAAGVVVLLYLQGGVAALVATSGVVEKEIRSLPDFRGDALFSTWLTRIAVRVTMRSVRRRLPRAASLDDVFEPASAAPGPEQVTAARETLTLVEALLAELRPKRRAAFVLHVLEGYSMEEVAAILSASTAAVKVRVHDARRHIERRLKQNPAMVAVLNRSGGES